MTKTYTYVLQDCRGRVYVGVTRNPKRRLAEHKTGMCKTSARLTYQTFTMIWKWWTEDPQLALKLEKYLHGLSDHRVVDMTIAFPKWCPGLEALVADQKLTDWELRLYA